jgi:SnoaL-like domain
MQSSCSNCRPRSERCPTNEHARADTLIDDEPVSDIEKAVINFLEVYDQHWQALDLEAIAALWDLANPTPIYIGDEYAEPIIGWNELDLHWARHAARLREAHVRSTVVNVNQLAPDLVMALVCTDWVLTATESPTNHHGSSWITMVLRLRPEGWRITHQSETPRYLPHQAKEDPGAPFQAVALDAAPIFKDMAR